MQPTFSQWRVEEVAGGGSQVSKQGIWGTEEQKL